MTAPAIELREVRFRYPRTEEPALRGVDLRIEAGELVGVIGGTGSGRSTLALVMSGQIPSFVEGRFEGEALIFGRSTRGRRGAELAEEVGILYQDPESQLYGLTVEEEVTVGLENRGLEPEEIRARVAWALEVVGLAGSEERSPYDLSGGEKQRAVLAGVLALRPRILVLDQPTAALDPLTRNQLWELLEALVAEGRTVVAIDQDLDRLVRVAHRLVWMDGGRVRADGAPREVVADPEALAASGVRPPQVARLAAALRLSPLPLGVEEVASRLGGSSAPGPAPAPRPAAGRPGMAPAGDPLVVCEGVEHTFLDGTRALRGVDLRIWAGEFLAVLGPNGSGKTTLARHLNGLLRPTAGRVLVGGRDTREATTAELAATVGYLFQDPNHQLVSRTVREEIAVGPRARGLPEAEARARAEEVMERLGLASIAEEHPLHLTLADKQRVAIASVVALDPAALVLDEPTTALDARETEGLLALLRDLRSEGRTVVLITHDMELVVEADRCLVLAEGRVVFDGPPRALFADDGVLGRASLEPPQVARLARMLGVEPPWLDLAEAVAALGRVG
jgi:energy-coupling factor transporter ATP-binding protein EcfA2